MRCNWALVDALTAAGGLARGVATVEKDVSRQTLHRAGVRGVRFNFVKRLVSKLPHEDLRRIAAGAAGGQSHAAGLAGGGGLTAAIEALSSTLGTHYVISVATPPAPE